MFRFAIDKGIIVAVATLVICVLGVVAVFRLPVQMTPEMDVTTLMVTTRWPGATPQEIEKEILVEQEEYLRSIPGITKMTSEATTGRARIDIEFTVGADIGEALIRTNNALAQVTGYPENVDKPNVRTTPPAANAFMFYAARAVRGNPLGVDIESERNFFEDYIAAAMERVPGVAEVTVGGGSERQVRIEVNPEALASRGLTMADVRQAIRRRNRDTSGGDLDAGKRRYLVRTLGRVTSVEELEAVIIARRDGVPVYLRDVGRAEIGNAEVRGYGWFNGERGMVLSVNRQIGANLISVMGQMQAQVAQINEVVLRPRGMELELINEDVQYVRDAVKVVAQNLAIGAVLAASVLYLFLRALRPTLAGAIGIPICTIAAFFGLLVTGSTINVMSLAGIAFAIGMTLDNAIVVLENIHRHLRQGKPTPAAALDGVGEVWPAVLASTLTTVLVFVPVMLIEEEAGQLYAEIAIAIAAAILFSMLVAVTLVPSAVTGVLRFTAGPQVTDGLARFGAGFQRGLMQFVRWLMAGVVRRLVLIGVAVAATAAIIGLLTPRAEYLPEGEEPKTFSMMFAPPGYNVGQMRDIAQELSDWLEPHRGADPARYWTGDAEIPAINSTIIFSNPARNMLIVTTRRSGEIDELRMRLAEKFEQYPGMRSFTSRGSIFSGNMGGTRSVDLDISGPELAPLFEVALQAFIKARQVLPGTQIRPSPPSITMGQPMIELRPDWERAAELGVRADALGYAVWAFTDGAYVDDFYLADRKVDIFLYSEAGIVNRAGDIDRIPIYTERGGVVPLGAVVSLVASANTETIRRVNGERTVTLSIVSPPDVALETAVEIVEQRLIDELHASGAVPDGVTVRIAGASDKLHATRTALSGNFLLAVALSYLLMAAVFRHWGYPLLILLTVPLGIAGGIFGLWFMNLLPGVNLRFDMITMLGFLVLIGLVVNNPILLVEQTRANLRAGMNVVEAVVEGTRTRLRPIMMTTLTTVVGLSPLVLVPRAGTELYRGLGIIVLFGLLFSSLLTLTFIPSVLSLILVARNRFAGRPAPVSAIGGP